MNCNDISRCLDEREMADLSAAESAELEAHVSECERCAEQWRVSRRLLAFRSEIPPVPESLRERARQLDEACEPNEDRRRLRRPLIIGSLLLVGATSAMFAMVPWPDEGAELAE